MRNYATYGTTIHSTLCTVHLTLPHNHAILRNHQTVKQPQYIITQKIEP